MINAPMFLVAALSAVVLYLFFVVNDNEIILGAIVIAGIAFVIKNMRDNNLVMEGE